jgi:RNase H-fold protein (predicted Holliday junction resolvase)
MKKLIIVVVAFFAINNAFAQSNLFDKFEDQEDVNAIIVNKKMFSLLSKMDVNDKETQQYVNMIKKLDNLKVFVTDSDRKANEMKATADKYLKSAGLEELMRITEKDKSVKIYVKSGATESQVKELFMFVQGTGKEETVMMLLTGLFDLDDLSVLTKKMNLPGSEDLNKASKGKK